MRKTTVLLAGLALFSLGCDGGESDENAKVDTVADVEAEPIAEEDAAAPASEAPLFVEVLEASLSAPIPAQIVFGRLKGEGLGTEVVLEGMLRETSTFVDVDESPEELYPFQVVLLTGADEVLWRDSIREPVQVREFLGNAGLQEMGIDPINILPEVGDFVFPMPDLDEAETLRIERIELDGEATILGTFPLADIPEMPEYEFADAPVTKIVGNAPPEEALDVVILGDGYTEDELGLFKTHAGKISTAFTQVQPYSEYFKRLNFYRVDIPSQESGASYDCSDTEEIEGCVDNFRETAFGSVFPLRLGVLLGMEVSDRAIFQLKQWSVYQAASLAPFDTVVILVNTKKYGAFGIYNASLSAYLDNLGRVTVHEMGHSFSLLGDEYVVEGDICQAYLLTPDYPNLSPLGTTPSDVKWVDWLTWNVPLPTPSDDAAWSDAVGLFAGAGAGCVDYYRPKADCLMRSTSSGAPLCPVCKEQTIHRFYETFDYLSADGVRADGETLVLAHDYGAPATGEWRVNGELAGDAMVPLAFERPAPGTSEEYQVKLVVRDGTEGVRRGTDTLEETVEATVRVTAPE